MTLAVGLVLILVFGAFAVLMFLERLSALLALPLMAAAFLLIASVADLIAPATKIRLRAERGVDAFGRATASVVREDGDSRYAEWLAIRHLQQTLRYEKTRLLVAVAQRLSAIHASQPDNREVLRVALAAAYDDEQRFNAEAASRLAVLSDFYAQPPFHAGQTQRFLTSELAAIDIGVHVRALANVLERVTPDQQSEQLQQALETLRTAAARAQRSYPAPENERSLVTKSNDAIIYISEYFLAMFQGGAFKLISAIMATIFGGMFAVYVKNLKVAETVVYWTAEFAGEQPRVITLAVFVVTAVIFTSVGGLGTVIMLGTIILPVLRSIGLSPVVGAGTFLIAISMGGTLQPAQRELWLTFYGLPPNELDPILWTMVGVWAVTGLGWIWWGTRRSLLSSFSSEPVERAKPKDDGVSVWLMIAPLVPVVLVYFARLDAVPAFTLAITYMYLAACRQQGAARMLARSLIEGAQTVMPPVLLMIGIGMLLVSLTTAPVQGYLTPLLSNVVPTSRLGYIIAFGLAAPLALYRGPLNVWGMGLAVSAILLATSGLAPVAILGAILAAGMLQGVCDPTNTANVWIAGFQGVTVNQILRFTLLPIWAAAVVAVLIFGFWFVN